MNKVICISALLLGFFAALLPITTAHAQVEAFAPQLKVSISPATRLFNTNYGPTAANRAFKELGLNRLGEDKYSWSGASASAIVFIHISRAADNKSNLVYLVSASTTRDEAEWNAQALQVKIGSGFRDAAPPPPARRGVCPVQWCQIRVRDGRGENPEQMVMNNMNRKGWKETGRSPIDRVGRKGNMTLLARWEPLPNNQLRYFVFVFIDSDPQKDAARACEDFANALMARRID